MKPTRADGKAEPLNPFLLLREAESTAPSASASGTTTPVILENTNAATFQETDNIKI